MCLLLVSAVVPPGHSASGTNVTKCPSGYYKAAWTLTDTADCTPCGSGIDTEDGLEIKRYRQDGRPSASVFVAGGSASCCKCGSRGRSCAKCIAFILLQMASKVLVLAINHEQVHDMICVRPS